MILLLGAANRLSRMAASRAALARDARVSERMTPMHRDQRTAVLETIDQVLKGLAQQRVKRASPLTEPGGHDGPSSHPSAKTDDGTIVAREGERSEEHSKTNKEDREGLDPESQSDAQEGSQDSAQTAIGIESASTGKTPDEETEGADGGKDDPGSDHPARTDNEDLGGGKYAAAVSRLDVLCKEANALGNEILSAIVERGSMPKAAEAAAWNGTLDQTPEAAAVAEAVAQRMRENAASFVQIGREMAEKVASFYDSFFQTLTNQQLAKAAEAAAEETGNEGDDDEEEDEDERQVGDDTGEGDAAAADVELPDLGLSDADAQALLEVLLSAEAPDSEAAVAAGGQPAAAPPPPTAEDLAASDDELAMLAQAMDELGVQPEELATAAAAKTAEALRALQKQARAARAGGSSPRAQKYARIRDYIMELTGRKA